MKTEIIVLADESGSMSKVRDDANGSFRQFLEEQRAVEGEARLTLVKFSSKVMPAYQAVDIQQAEELNLAPNGMTALYDAIGMTFRRHDQRIKDQAWADLRIFVILTDGADNVSREFTLADVRAITKSAEADGWKFMYLMSNQDAFEQAKLMGSTGQYTRTHVATGQGTQEAYSYASGHIRDLRNTKV